MNDKKYAGILRCIMNRDTFETTKGFSKITGEPQIGCRIRLKRKLAKSMANKLASKFNLVDKARWKEITQMSDVGSFIDFSENANVKDALYKHMLENAQYKEDDDGTLSGTLAY